MINPKIPWAFNQFELNFIGLASFIQTHLQHIVPNLPVFMNNNGDFNYFVRKKFIQSTNEEIIQKVPRFTFKVDDIQLNQQEDTNQYNKIWYNFDLKDGRGPLNYCCATRRKAYNVMITTNFVSSNFITMLNHLEVFATLAARENVFTYHYMGMDMHSAFTVMGMNNDVPSIDMGQGGTRNCVSISQLELQVHLLVPRIESIALVDDSGFEQTIFDIITPGDNYTDEDKDQIIQDNEDEEESENSAILGTDPDKMSPSQYWPEYDAGSVIPTDQKKSPKEKEQAKYRSAGLKNTDDLTGKKGYDPLQEQVEIPAGSVIPTDQKIHSSNCIDNGANSGPKYDSITEQ